MQTCFWFLTVHPVCRHAPNQSVEREHLLTVHPVLMLCRHAQINLLTVNATAVVVNFVTGDDGATSGWAGMLDPETRDSHFFLFSGRSGAN